MLSSRFLITLMSFVIILGGTFLAIQFAKGYRPTEKGVLQPTGLLVANSFPVGAQVYLNGRLTTATDNTLHLDPGTYEVEIKKDGYTPWKKTLEIQKELVTQTNALLFPVTTGGISPLTFTGAGNVTPSPDGQKVVFYAASASAQTKNGIYILELSDGNPLSFQKGARQIAQSLNSIELATAKFLWSPDSSQILLIANNRNILLDPTRMNDLSAAQDVSYRLKQVLAEWEQEAYARERIRLSKFPVEVQQIATQSAKNLYFSPDEKKLMYTATGSATLPDELIPPVPSASTQVEARTLEAGNIYVYDLTEDRNFQLGTEKDLVLHPFANPILAVDLYNRQALSLEASPSAFVKLQGETMDQTWENFRLHYSSASAGGVQWFPDSRHVLSVKNGRIIAKEYDGTNEVAVYSGPFVNSFAYPWPDGSKLIILANFNQELEGVANLYAVGMR